MRFRFDNSYLLHHLTASWCIKWWRPVAIFALTIIPGCTNRPTADAIPTETVQYEQGVKLMASGNVGNAKAVFDGILQRNPRYSPAYFAEAQIESSQGNSDKAVAYLETLYQAAPGTPHVLCRLAELRVASGDFVKGLDAVKVALEKEPDCPVAQKEYGLEMAAAGKMDEAIRHFEAARKATPDDERITIPLAKMLAQNGRTADAWRILDHYPIAPTTSLQARYLHGWMLAEVGRDGKRDDQQALKLLNGVLAVAPDNGPSNLEKGRILLRSGHIQEALACLQKATKVMDANTELLSSLAEAHRRMKSLDANKLTRSVRNFEILNQDLYKARQLYLKDSENRDNRVRLARKEAAFGNYKVAQDLLTQVLKQNPNDVEVLELLTPQGENSPHALKPPPSH